MRQDLGEDENGQNEETTSELNRESKPSTQSEVSEIGSSILLNQGVKLLLHFLLSSEGTDSDETVEGGSEEGVDWRTRHGIEAKRVDNCSGVAPH